MQARNAVKEGKAANESPLTQLTREWQVRFHHTKLSVRTVHSVCILCRNDSQSLFLPFSGRLANSHTTALWPLSLSLSLVLSLTVCVCLSPTHPVLFYSFWCSARGLTSGQMACVCKSRLLAVWVSPYEERRNFYWTLIRLLHDRSWSIESLARQGKVLIKTRITKHHPYSTLFLCVPSSLPPSSFYFSHFPTFGRGAITPSIITS